jgi:hypothetical protein
MSDSHAVSPEALRDEQRRLRRVRFIVDFTSSVLMQSGMSREEGEALVAAARDRILELFPGREETYQILYARRFARLLDSCTSGETPSRPGRVLPFRQR